MSISLTLYLTPREFSRAFYIWAPLASNFDASCLCTFLARWLLFLRYSQSVFVLWHKSIGRHSHTGIFSESQEKRTNWKCVKILQNEDHWCFLCFQVNWETLSLCWVVNFRLFFLSDRKIFPFLIVPNGSPYK